MSYNGWSNYQTWAMSLWMDNEEDSYHYARELVADLDEDDEYPRVTLADQLKAWHEDLMPELDASVWSDLLSSAFEQVEWLEIADSLLSEVATEARS